jgi:hypothetical protein
MATGSNIRVGDADRDAVVAQLREHYGDGRLTLDELNERLDQTLRARTGADLAAVMRDLPSPGSSWASATAGPARLTSQGDQARPHGQSPWGSQSQSGSQWGEGDQGNGFGPRRHGLSVLAAALPVLLAVWGLLLLAGFLAFGTGGGRPLAIVLLLAAVALIRRMFGGRRMGRRYGGRCGRRW